MREFAKLGKFDDTKPTAEAPKLELTGANFYCDFPLLIFRGAAKQSAPARDGRYVAEKAEEEKES